MADLNTWFEKGMTRYAYIHGMTAHKENLLTIYNAFVLPDPMKDALHSMQKSRLRAIVITEDWCGDAMLNLPVFMRMADEALIDVRFIQRDKNLELMDRYLTNKSKSIPIIIFIDEKGKEIMKWGPRAPKLQQLVEERKKKLPAKDDPRYEKAFKLFADKISTLFTTDHALWEEVSLDIIKKLLAKINVNGL
ncbi:thioredoxin family protein [Fictibacillus phosphorivorans]|uniref:thioredoxin family protein n=1 Tax=Fictibacillus phosphorivorans TaxID=1221500 RepID=UPI00203A4164|nr:thioredoxin family protein [Fictibacillus phosphorivorans]MCM3719223.1 thioredoxin family protein [Fictibacillus phosphorivorans]MCM3776845.1 thioredoxin family protein [Fictibacillus phosphorivorans]